MTEKLRVVVDGETLASSSSGWEHAASVEEIARRALAGSAEPRVVTGVWLDGRPVDPDALDDLAAIPLRGAREVCLETSLLREVARRSLEQAGEFAGEVQRSLLDSAEALRQGELQEGSRRLAEALDGLSVLCFTVEAAGRGLRAGSPSFQDFADGLLPWLTALADAQEKGDWVRAADYLEYELAPRLGALPEDLERAREDGPSAPAR